MVSSICSKEIKRKFASTYVFAVLLKYCLYSASKGLFRKPDWDVAAGYYERAGNVYNLLRDLHHDGGELTKSVRIATSFKIAKSYDQAVQAYGKASEALFKADA